MNVLIFLGMLVVGIVLIVYTTTWVKLFGRLDWAERWMGPAGTYGAWKLIGLAFIVGGMIVLRFY